jgi:hypothetical protein
MGGGVNAYETGVKRLSDFTHAGFDAYLSEMKILKDRQFADVMLEKIHRQLPSSDLLDWLIKKHLTCWAQHIELSYVLR